MTSKHKNNRVYDVRKNTLKRANVAKRVVFITVSGEGLAPGPVIGAREFVIDSVAFYVQHGFVFRLYECYALALGNKDPWYASFVR